MNKEELSKIIAEHKTWSGSVRAMGLKPHGGNIDNLKKKVTEYGIDVSHFIGRNHERKYTKEVLQIAATKSLSFAELCENLGVKWSGGIHTYLKKRLADYGIDTSHFLGKKKNSGQRHKSGVEKRVWAEVLVERTTGVRQLSYVLRRAMLEAGVVYKCSHEECPVKGDWLGKSIRLQVHHKNGNNTDDRLDNVCFLCPNCHSQTPNFCNGKGLTELTSVKLQSKKRRKS
jgi:hypothetical protein